MENKFQSAFKPPRSPNSDCCVCLQTCLHPVELPCKHIFCFLCIKGAAHHNRGQCPLCRQPLPQNYLAQPKLLAKSEPSKEAFVESVSRDFEEFYWYYEGKNGWWKYDERTNIEIEKRFNKGEKVFELLIAGIIYIINTEAMVQCQRSNPARSRKMKRDKTIPDEKGIAGLTRRRLEYQSGKPSNDETKSKDSPKKKSSTDINDKRGNSLDSGAGHITSVRNVFNENCMLSLATMAINPSLMKSTPPNVNDSRQAMRIYNMARNRNYVKSHYDVEGDDNDADDDNSEDDGEDLSSFIGPRDNKGYALSFREVAGSSSDSESLASGVNVGTENLAAANCGNEAGAKIIVRNRNISQSNKIANSLVYNHNLDRKIANMDSKSRASDINVINHVIGRQDSPLLIDKECSNGLKPCTNYVNKNAVVKASTSKPDKINVINHRAGAQSLPLLISKESNKNTCIDAAVDAAEALTKPLRKYDIMSHTNAHQSAKIHGFSIIEDPYIVSAYDEIIDLHVSNIDENDNDDTDDDVMNEYINSELHRLELNN